MKVIKPQGGLD